MGAAPFAYPDIEKCPFPLSVRAQRSRLEEIARRANPIGPEMVTALEKNGNWSSDWTQVAVLPGFNPEFVRDCMFHGRCVLGCFSGAEVPVDGGGTVRTGLYRSTLTDSVVESEAAVDGCPQINHYHVAEGAVVAGSTLIGSDSPRFGNGEVLPIGIESGGRYIPAYADIDLLSAAAFAQVPAGGPEAVRARQFAEQYASAARGRKGYVAAGARIISAVRVKESWIGANAVVSAGAIVERSTLLGAEIDERVRLSTSVVRDSIVQAGCEVTDYAIVDHSILLEHSHAERHAKVTASLIGPNSGVGEGEVTASFVGPFVGFHHQALLIAAFWPEGRGNVGHGANVGSNHTSRLPDQEVWPGEGCFFGLGCNIRFPVNFRESPYTVVANGSVVLPQKLSFPFSLLTPPPHRPHDVPTGFLQLIPAWGLSHNLYATRRNEAKFSARNRARQNAIDTRVFRPEILALMRTAYDRLNAVNVVKELYLPGDIPGLGKNFLLETDRLQAVHSYQFFLEFTELELRAGGSGSPLSDAEAAKYIEMATRIASLVRESRRKDDERGVLIIDDYADHHVPMSEDTFAAETERWAADIRARYSGGETVRGHSPPHP